MWGLDASGRFSIVKSTVVSKIPPEGINRRPGPGPPPPPGKNFALCARAAGKGRRRLPEPPQ